MYNNKVNNYTFLNTVRGANRINVKQYYKHEFHAIIVLENNSWLQLNITGIIGTQVIYNEGYQPTLFCCISYDPDTTSFYIHDAIWSGKSCIENATLTIYVRE